MFSRCFRWGAQPNEQSILVVMNSEYVNGMSCSLCLHKFNNSDVVVRLRACHPDHAFHKDCGLSISIAEYVDREKRCPTCQTSYGIRTGPMPEGKFVHSYSEYTQIPGYEGCGSFILQFTIPSGVQDYRHPNPGIAFSGTRRTAYLPATVSGKRVLDLIQVAWDRKFMFRVGESISTGYENTVVWNGIHMKTLVHGGPQYHAYPDPTYLERVTRELAEKGIIETSSI